MKSGFRIVGEAEPMMRHITMAEEGEKGETLNCSREQRRRWEEQSAEIADQVFLFTVLTSSHLKMAHTHGVEMFLCLHNI